MFFKLRIRTGPYFQSLGGVLVMLGLGLSTSAAAQDRDRDRDRGSTRLEQGTVIPVRTNDSIDVERNDNRVYGGSVDADVRGTDGRLAIPRGSTVELIVRVVRDNDLILDLESVMVSGQRYAIKTDPNRIESQRDNSLVGSILGAISGGQGEGRAVRIPRDTVVTFRLQRPLDVGVSDRGAMRDGNHYHDYYRDNDRNH